jgi:hypothetical protein
MTHTPEQLAIWRRMERIRLCIDASRAVRVALANRHVSGQRPAEETS